VTPAWMRRISLSPVERRSPSRSPI
jgi:hypothetical protein